MKNNLKMESKDKKGLKFITRLSIEKKCMINVRISFKVLSI